MENAVNKWILEDGSPSIRIVDDSSARIIRYMELGRFVQLLTSSSLFFSRIDQFEDAYEGNVIFGMDKAGDFEAWVKSCFVSSWSYFYGAEQYSLWKNFVGPANTGIAIVNTVKNVMNSIHESERDNIKPYITNYMPGDFKGGDLGDIITNGITKLEYYAYEQEIRLMHYAGIRNEEWGQIPQIIQVPVDLNLLIRYVIFSPFNRPWMNEHLKQLIERFGVDNVTFVDSQIQLRRW
jgi:hypothetical protein